MVIQHIIDKLLLFSAGAMAERFAEEQTRCSSLARTQSGSEQVYFVQGILSKSLEYFSIKCCKTKPKVINLANQKGRKQSSDRTNQSTK